MNPVDVAQLSLQPSVSLAGPVVNILHEENEQSTSFVSSSCVSTSEDHVHTCSTAISTDMSLNITKPIYSTDTSTSDICQTTDSTGSICNYVASMYVLMW